MENKTNGFFSKLPFRRMAEKIPASIREKVPLLDKAIPFANQIVCAFLAWAVVVWIAVIVLAVILIPRLWR